MRSIAFFCLLASLVSLVAARGKTESYTALAVASGSAGSRTVSVEISIDRYTTDQELGDYLLLLSEKGQEVARERLRDVDLGRVVAESESGMHISVARSYELNGEKVIRILTASPILERYRDEQGTDYPFTIIELRIQPKGSGEGSVTGGARIQFKDGLLSFESQGSRYADLTNVQAKH